MNSTYDQVGLFLLSLAIGVTLSLFVKLAKKSSRLSSKIGGEFVVIFFLENVFVGSVLSLITCLFVRDHYGYPNEIIEPSVSVLLAAGVISIDFKHLVKTQQKKVGFSKILLASIILLRAIPDLETKLASIHIDLVSLHTNLWQVFNLLSALVFFLWLASLFLRGMDYVIMRRRNMPSSIKVLVIKSVRIAVYFYVLIWIFNLSGISLSSFAFISGALILGVGFGLQKIISNFVSGMIILAEGSVQPGHVLEVDGEVGLVKSVNTRYVSLIMRDNRELLVPNEEFVINKTCNWSYSDRNSRITMPVGVSYDSDVNKVRDLCIKAVANLPRVLSEPVPDCLLTAFGDSSIDFSVRFWIEDPEMGISNIKSEAYFAIWNTFKEHGIEIPFPQRVLTIKNTVGNIS